MRQAALVALGGVIALGGCCNARLENAGGTSGGTGGGADGGPEDAGFCPLAPACDVANLGVPATVEYRRDLDVGSPSFPPDASVWSADPDAGEDAGEACGPARLMLRLQSVAVTQGSATVYCLVDATDGVHSGIALTPETANLGGGNPSTFYFEPGSGIFWEQDGGPLAVASNLTLTYDCFQVVGDEWAQVLSAVSGAAEQAGGIPGNTYGWAFETASVAAAAAAVAIDAGSGDHLIFNAQQTIPLSDMLDLTNGRAWTIEESGGNWWSFDQWDWTLTVQSWGCAAPR